MSLNVNSHAKTYRIKDPKGNEVGKGSLTVVKVALLRIDPAYQRSPEQSWVDAHRPFDANKAGTIIVSARAGNLYIVDGGHRWSMALADGIETMAALVITGMTQQAEADYFVSAQRIRRPLTSYDLWRADIVRLDKDTLAIKTAVDQSHFQVGPNHAKGPNTISAIDALRYISRHYGIPVLNDTLRLTREHWLNLEKALTGQTLKGLANFIQRAKEAPHFEEGRLVHVMQRKAPLAILQIASQKAAKEAKTSPHATHIASAIADAYNFQLGKGRKIDLDGKRAL